MSKTTLRPSVKVVLALLVMPLLPACTAISPAAADESGPEMVMTKAPAPAVPMTAANTCNLPGLRQAILKQVNAARSNPRACGGRSFPAAGTLNWNAQLFSAAARHSADMAENNYFSHNSPRGTRVAERVSAQGYRWKSVGENIAAGNRTVDSVIDGWLKSEGHCSNIMDASFTEIAVACVAQPGSAYGTYWTMVLGRQQAQLPKARQRGT